MASLTSKAVKDRKFSTGRCGILKVLETIVAKSMRKGIEGVLQNILHRDGFCMLMDAMDFLFNLTGDLLRVTWEL